MDNNEITKLGDLANKLSSFAPQPRLIAEMTMPKINIPDFPQIRDYKMADYQYEVIMERIKDFEDELDDEHEVAVQLASFGKDILLSVTDIGYSNPNTLIFHGFVNGQKATLIQHMSMLSFLLLAVQKQDPVKPPRRIGFYVEDEEEQED